jgi:hypothetical protein
MKNISNEKILEHLKKKGYQAELQKETDQISVIINIHDIEFPLFFRLLADSPILQILVFIPSSFSEKTVAGTARLLHLLNKEMDIPGFGMDEDSKVIFFRISQPLSTEGELDTDLMDAYLESIKTVCTTFTPAIINVSQGTMTLEEILQKVREAESNS